MTKLKYFNVPHPLIVKNAKMLLRYDNGHNMRPLNWSCDQKVKSSASVLILKCVLSPCLSEVSCKTLEGVDGLKKLIYQVSLSMKDSSNTAFGSKLLGRLVSTNPQVLSV